MEKSKLFLFAHIFAIVIGLFSFKPIMAAPCVLVDPIQGDINITCKNARLSVSENGVRSLPNPNSVPLNTMVRIDWVQPFTGNTIVQSWDDVLQQTHFRQRVNGKWVHFPDRAYLQETGDNPTVTMKVQALPNGTKFWALGAIRDIMVWNGGN